MFKTQWTHKPVTLTEEQQKALEWEIADISEELTKADDLVSHHVMLTSNWNGPIVIVEGREGCEDTLFLTYYENPKWTYSDASESDQI
jgi:hypothetical protein